MTIKAFKDRYAEIRSDLSSKRNFPNTSVLANFSPDSQTLHIKNIEAENLGNLFSGPPTVEFCKKSAIVFHEITHWADMIGTLHGRSYLRNIYECHKLLNGQKQPIDEYKYFKYIELYDRSRRFMMPKYYRVLEDASAQHSAVDKWAAELSAGREFDASGKINDSSPIIFVRFFDKDRRHLLVRQPVVAGALWEANAVWSEMSTNNENIPTLPEDIGKVERYQVDKEFEDMYFNKDLTIYSAPVHLLSYFAKIEDIQEAYRISSILSHCVLNISSNLYPKIRPPTVLMPWRDLFKGFVRNNNPAFAFAVICSNAERWRVGANEYDWLDDALVKSGLPKSKKIFDDAVAIMQSNSSTQNANRYDTSLSYLLGLGPELLDARRSEPHPAITPSIVEKYQIVTPGIFDEDGEIFNIPGSKFDYSKFDPMFMWDAENKLFSWTQNFLDACRT